MTKRPDHRIRSKPSRVKKVGAYRAGSETIKKVTGRNNKPPKKK